MKTQRREALKKMVASFVGITGVTFAAKAKPFMKDEKIAYDIVTQEKAPLFAGRTRYGNLIFIAGKGAHVAPFEIKAHTEIVLKELEAELVKSGSSMQKVLKVNVYLDDMADFAGMNEIYRGRFGINAPVRSTVAVAKGGVPGNSLVEMDCIAYI